MRRALLSLVGLVLAGCDGSSPTGLVGPESSKPAFATVELFADCPDSVAAVDIPAAVRDSIQAGIAPNYFDGRLAIVARRVPGGFAGEWIGTDGRFTIGLVDPTRRGAALAALHADPLLPRSVPLDAAVVPARWNFAQLVEWDRYLGARIGREPELSSVDRDELANRLVYGVRTAAARDRLSAALRAAGAPCGLIRIKAEPGPTPAGATRRDHASAT